MRESRSSQRAARRREARAAESRDTQPRWTPTILLSLLLHVVGFTLAIALPRLIPQAAQGPPVYVVDLVALPAAGAAGGAPPAGGPAASSRPREITKPPAVEKAITIPDRSAAKAAARKTPEPKRTVSKKPEARVTPPPKTAPAQKAAPGTAASAAEAGKGTASEQAAHAAPGLAPGAAGTGAGAGTGGTGSGAGDMFSYYFSIVNRRIESAWQKPIYPPTETSRRKLAATVRLTVTSSGRVTSTDLVISSGYEALDRSVLRAVEDAQPFPPFPEQLGSAPRTVQFEITLTAD